MQFSHLFEFGFKFNVDKIRELPDPPTPNTDLKLDETSDSAKVLNHPLASTGDDYNYSAYEPVPDIMPDEQEGAGTMYARFSMQKAFIHSHCEV